MPNKSHDDNESWLPNFEFTFFGYGNGPLQTIKAQKNISLNNVQQSMLRAVVFCIALGLYWFQHIWIKNSGLQEQTECFKDQLFEISYKFNQYFADNQSKKFALLILAGGMMDSLLLCLFMSFICYGRSYRVLLTYGIMYGIRSLTQELFQMPFPEGYLWEYPGIQSVVVAYHKTNDFFFSGHVGFCIIAFREFQIYNMKKLKCFAIACAVMQVFTMIFLRGHYTIDLIGGVICGHYFHILATDLDTFLVRNIQKILKYYNFNPHLLGNIVEKVEIQNNQQKIVAVEELTQTKITQKVLYPEKKMENNNKKNTQQNRNHYQLHQKCNDVKNQVVNREVHAIRAKA